LASAAAVLTSSARNAGGSVAAFKAPLLDRLLSVDDPEQRQVVLDLGGPGQMLLDRLSTTRSCRLEIADFVANGGLPVLEAIESDDESDRAYAAGIIRRLLPRPNKEPLDLILCWDLPNYMSLESLRRLCEVLAGRAAPGCKLHMLIAYSKREMPSAPAHYVLGANGLLEQLRANDGIGAAPRYSPEDLGVALGRFRYERGVLLANGMQEFVYAWPE
jgi:hypothetical protein